MDWGKLRVFHAAAKAGSFTHAGEILEMSQSAVSRQVSALEKDLNVILFHRHARGLILTEQGEILYRTSQEVFNQLETVFTRLSDSKTKPSGDLRVTTTLGLGSHWMTQRLGEFINLYPDINVKLLLHYNELDIAMREADVAVWLREPTQNDLIRRKLFTVHLHLYASLSYIRQYGTPRNLEDLGRHRVITFGRELQQPIEAINWLETVYPNGREKLKPVLTINSLYGLRRAVKEGIGIAVLPDYIVGEDSDIVPIFRDADLPKLDTYFVYPEELKNAKRVEVFRDFLLTKARQWSF